MENSRHAWGLNTHTSVKIITVKVFFCTIIYPRGSWMLFARSWSQTLHGTLGWTGNDRTTDDIKRRYDPSSWQDPTEVIFWHMQKKKILKCSYISTLYSTRKYGFELKNIYMLYDNASSCMPTLLFVVWVHELRDYLPPPVYKIGAPPPSLVDKKIGIKLIEACQHVMETTAGDPWT